MPGRDTAKDGHPGSDPGSDSGPDSGPDSGQGEVQAGADGAVEAVEITPPDHSGTDTDGGETPREVYGEILDLKALHAREVSQPDLADFGSVRPYIIMGTVIALLLFGSMTIWSMTAPLAKGAIAPGKITVASNRKSIQHLEGGIVRAIHINNGDRVAAGDVLMELDSSRAMANQTIQNKRAAGGAAAGAECGCRHAGVPGGGARCRCQRPGAGRAA